MCLVDDGPAQCSAVTTLRNRMLSLTQRQEKGPEEQLYLMSTGEGAGGALGPDGLLVPGQHGHLSLAF